MLKAAEKMIKPRKRFHFNKIYFNDFDFNPDISLNVFIIIFGFQYFLDAQA